MQPQSDVGSNRGVERGLAPAGDAADGLGFGTAMTDAVDFAGATGAGGAATLAAPAPDGLVAVGSGVKVGATRAGSEGAGALETGSAGMGKGAASGPSA